MTGKGRPRIGPQIIVRIPADLLAEIDAVAEEYGITRATTIRKLLTGHLVLVPDGGYWGEYWEPPTRVSQRSR